MGEVHRLSLLCVTRPWGPSHGNTTYTAGTGGHGAAARPSVPAGCRDTAETREQTLSVLLSSAGATLRADLQHLGSCQLSGPAAVQETWSMVSQVMLQPYGKLVGTQTSTPSRTGSIRQQGPYEDHCKTSLSHC